MQGQTTLAAAFPQAAREAAEYRSVDAFGNGVALSAAERSLSLCDFLAGNLADKEAPIR